MASKKIPNTLRRMASRLFSSESAQTVFIDALVDPVEYAVAVIWVKERPQTNPFTPLPCPGWMPDYVDLVPFEQRPGRHERHEAGDFYCVDPSSVFMAAGLSLIGDAGNVETVLDVCSSPGGKSIMAWRALKPAHVWSNEVIGKRIPALISNLRRCEIAPATVINVDTKFFPEQAHCVADVVLVDAPCSGQTLIARGKESPGCFHPATINMNANRQRRILANSAASVKPAGWLVYMTCTYSMKENERNVEWLLKKFPHLNAVEVNSVSDYRSPLTEAPCYRMWPMNSIGAGGFFAVFRRDESDTESRGTLSDFYKKWQSEAGSR